MRDAKMTAERAPSRLAGCTAVLQSGMAQAFVLANSFRKFHRESEFFILVVDGPPDLESNMEGARFMSLGELGLDAGEEWRLPMLHSATELLSVLKPALLRHLLTSGTAAATYFEPSIEIFASLEDLIAPSTRENIVMVDAAADSKLDGSDPGKSFITVNRNADAFLRAWFERLANPSLDNGSKRLADSYPHRTLTDPAFNVGYWNLDPATFAWKEDHYEVEGKLLRTFNFRGYDSDKPHLLSKYQGTDPRILLSQHPAVAKICDEYREQLIRAGHDKLKSTPYRFGFLPSGLPMDHRMLRLYREALTKFKQGLDREPPSPFGAEGEEGFLNWLNEPLSGREPIITRYMLAVHNEREDVRQAFPDPIGADATGFRDWYLLFGQQEMDLPTPLLPPDAGRKGPDDSSGERISSARRSVNVAGYFHAELGIGTAARALVAALEASEIPFNTIAFAGTANRQDHPFEHRQAEKATADINIICINADQIATFAEKNGPELLHGRYTIGVWFWEVEDFPRLFHDAFNYVDEIWVASEFMRETFLKVSPKPVFKFHLPILKPQIDPISLAQICACRISSSFFQLRFS